MRKREAKRTEKTIHQLKSSIDSIERMIEKSQQILRNTRPLQHRQVRSDSIDIRFNSHSKSKSRGKRQNSIVDSAEYFTQPSTNYLGGSRQVINKCISKEKSIRAPQKTKQSTFRNLQIQIEPTNHQTFETRDNILIAQDNQPISPINKGTYQKNAEKYFSDSSYATLQSQTNTVSKAPGIGYRRINTQNINDSWQSSYENQSLQRHPTQSHRFQDNSNRLKKIVLKRKNNKIKNYADFQRQRKRSQSRNKIFANHKKQGKFSYYRKANKNHQQQSYYTNFQNQVPHQFNSVRMATLSSARIPCQKNIKQTHQMDLEEFLKKVKKYGFVQRYLSRNQICCIYEYLCRSSIPQYKWPLYVVDEVYDKMRNSLKDKN